MPRRGRRFRIAVELNPASALSAAVFDGILAVARERQWALTDRSGAGEDGRITDALDAGPADGRVVRWSTKMASDADVRPDAAAVRSMAENYFARRGYSAVHAAPAVIDAAFFPAAYLADDDLIAASWLDRVLAAGRRVPDDAALLGVGNDVRACECRPVTLSSIDLGPRRIGLRAGRRLAAMLANKAVPAIDLVPPAGVVTRASTDCLAVADADTAAAVRFAQDHGAGPLRVGDLLRASGLDRRALERRFVRHLGCPPAEYARRVRLDRAAERLRTTNRTIGEIAAECGFRLPQHLAVAFRRQFGQSPGDFRRTFRSDE